MTESMLIGCRSSRKGIRVEKRKPGVEGLSAYGPEFFERFNGMFAIGAWDTENQNLYISRDRFGVKPLYYWFNGKTFVFSSEIKAIIKHPEYEIDVDLGTLNEYFTFQNLFTYRTLFKGIEMLNTQRIWQ
ncbi:MAG: hypothetical protein GDA42_13200 [Ekhidna sp.]|nr:hypothetical protein [Ekhidna sp.]MBC6411383.1 hypothetical protein [Ekhidna sp.]